MKKFENIEATVIIKPEEVTTLEEWQARIDAARAKIQTMTDNDLPF